MLFEKRLIIKRSWYVKYMKWIFFTIDTSTGPNCENELNEWSLVAIKGKIIYSHN